MNSHPDVEKSGSGTEADNPRLIFNNAAACREARQYEAALRLYLEAAEAGYAPAQNDYATMLLNGIGTEPDPEEAAFWYHQAAEQGLAIAQYNLATRYRVGQGVAINAGEAVHWLSRAAERGCVEALCDLGVAHRLGHGVSRDVVRASELLAAAAILGDVTAMGNLADIVDELSGLAEQGNPRAQGSLARIYGRGLGVDQDPLRARFWAELSSPLADQRKELISR